MAEHLSQRGAALLLTKSSCFGSGSMAGQRSGLSVPSGWGWKDGATMIFSLVSIFSDSRQVLIGHERHVAVAQLTPVEKVS